MPRHGVLVDPFQDRPAGELYATVADDAAKFAVDPGQCAKLPGNPRTRQAGVRHEAKAFARAVVDHRQHPELPRGAEAFGYEVQ